MDTLYLMAGQGEGMGREGVEQQETKITSCVKKLFISGL